MSLKPVSVVALAVFFVLVAGLVCQAADPVSAGAAAGWSQWRGAVRDGKSSDNGLLKAWPEGGPKQLWKVTGIGQGFSSVSIGGGLIYTTGKQESVVGEKKIARLRITAVDMDGKVKWAKDVGEAYMRSYKGTRSTPTYDNGNLYLQSGNGEVGCYDAQTGEAKWTRNNKEFEARRVQWGFAESVLVVDGLAIVSPGGSNAFMVAFDKVTGSTVWQSEAFGGAQYSSAIHVVYEGVPMIINGSHQGLFCVDPKTGKTLWTQEFAKGNTANCPTPAFSAGHVFWAVGYGKGGICVKLSVSGAQVTAAEAWRTDMDCHHGGFVIQDGYIYGNHKDGYACLDLKTGEQKWNAADVGKGSLCYADGMLYLFGEKDGKVSLAEATPKAFTPTGTFNVAGEGPSWAHPVVGGGRLYLRYDDNLYCFNVKSE